LPAIFSIPIAALPKGLHTDQWFAQANSRYHDSSRGVQATGLYSCSSIDNPAPGANVPIALSGVLCDAPDVVENIFEQKTYTYPILVCNLPTNRLT
jgi:hypothetical protein